MGDRVLRHTGLPASCFVSHGRIKVGTEQTTDRQTGVFYRYRCGVTCNTLFSSLILNFDCIAYLVLADVAR